MKALTLAAALLITVSAVFSQKNNVETASIAISKYESRKDAPPAERYGYLKEAKTYIDKAHKHESTSNYSKMWYIRGRVYFNLILDTMGGKNLDPDPIEKAVISLMNAKKTDEKGRLKREIPPYLAQSTLAAFNIGVQSYAKEDYERALKYFNLILKALPENDPDMMKQGQLDEGKVKRYASIVSKKMGKTELTKSLLEELIAMTYADPEIYVDMKNILLEEGDTAQALEILTRGRKLYEDNRSLLMDEINTYIKLDMSKVLIERLTKAIELDPYNALMYYNRGQVNQEQFQQMEEGPDRDSTMASAIKDYEKALELEPGYGDAMFNLGALYVNMGKNYDDLANSYGYKETEKYNAATKKANEYYENALKYLEPAYEMDSTDPTLKQVLGQLYVRTNQLDKYKALKGE